MKKIKIKMISLFFPIIILIFVFAVIFQEFYWGDYKIDKQWIGSELQGRKYCDDCLFITFYEGCNRYFTYYFENQHDFDSRFHEGNAVNIHFDKKGGIDEVTPALKYRSKC